MGYSSTAYERAEAEVNSRRVRSETENRMRIEKIEAEIPEIKELNRQLSETSVDLAKLILKHDGDMQKNLERLRENNLYCQRSIGELLSEHGYPKDYLDVKYVCPICCDRGVTGGSRCVCFSELLNKFAVEELNINSAMKLCSFDSFSLEYYRGKTDSSGIDCYSKMSDIFSYCKRYAQTFSQNSPNIFMIGKTGLGKTHLSLSIAKTVSERGFITAYGSVLNYLRAIEAEHFGRAEDPRADTLTVLLNADLLILDDLGSEYDSSFYAATIYNIINTRINQGSPTVISSNLSLAELQKKYNDRIISRILGTYDLLRFVGEDIRQIKRLESVNK